MTYTRASTDWLAACRYGVGFHWTARTAPRSGPAVSFQDAVAKFKLGAFLRAVERSSADYVIFTATHALHMMPCPHPVVDSILPDRTAERDLLGEIADGLVARSKRLIVYYNHSCNQGDDSEWERAIGYHDQAKDRLVANLSNIVQWMGEHYGARISGWWFDSAYSLGPTGPENAVTTDMEGFRFPWEHFTQAAKGGHAQRLVTYNAGIGHIHMYTDHQDYWAGEAADLSNPPDARYLPNGLQWHGWVCLDNPHWVMTDNDPKALKPRFSDNEIIEFLAICRKHSAPMCFNVAIFQDGLVSEEAICQMQRIGDVL